MAERKQPITISRAVQLEIMIVNNNKKTKKPFSLESTFVFFFASVRRILSVSFTHLVYPTSGISGTGSSHWSRLLYKWLRYYVQNYRLINHVTTFRRSVYTILNISRRYDDVISDSRIIVIEYIFYRYIYNEIYYVPHQPCLVLFRFYFQHVYSSYLQYNNVVRSSLRYYQYGVPAKAVRRCRHTDDDDREANIEPILD